MSGCNALVYGASDGVAAALTAVDCMAGQATAGAFARLFGTQGALLPALTLLLTLYIALFALGLLTGRTRLGVAALTPRMLVLGAVLTFATSWIAYQSVLWNLAVGAPDQIAGVLLGTRGQASQVFAVRIDILFQAIADAAQNASEQQGAAAAAGAAVPGQATGTFAPASLVWLAAVLLLLGTVGLLVTTRIVLAVLLALGPVFIVLGLVKGTRGLCAGWIRTLTMVALAPLFAVIGGALTIELAIPVVQRLAGPEGIEARPAFALFLIAAVHCTLMALALKTAATMVGQWRVFGLGGGSAAEPERAVLNERPAAFALPGPGLRPAAHHPASRTADPAGQVARSTVAETRTTRTVLAPARVAGLSATGLPPLRAQGIGSRWRRPQVQAEIFR